MGSLKGILKIAASGSLMLLMACMAGSRPGPNPGAVTPGLGVKEAALFDTRQKVEEALGKPESETVNPFNSSNVIVQYPTRGLEISYLDGAVGSVVLYAPGQRDGVNWQTYQGSTSEGIWPESNVKTIKSTLGKPVKEFPQAIVYPGLWIRLDNGGEVESFSISKDEAGMLKNN
ncbi:MAG: hypothetical protein K6A35_06135 [bacterium]|nr:hypothetical protein [bacterium]